MRTCKSHMPIILGHGKTHAFLSALPNTRSRTAVAATDQVPGGRKDLEGGMAADVLQSQSYVLAAAHRLTGQDR